MQSSSHRCYWYYLPHHNASHELRWFRSAYFCFIAKTKHMLTP
jgi:hypothetical protein